MDVEKNKRVASVSPTYSNFKHVATTYNNLQAPEDQGGMIPQDALDWYYPAERAWKKSLELNTAETSPYTFDDRLWPYQSADVNAMYQSKGLINANDRAMGKTVESIMASLAVYAERVLVVCPNMAMVTWQEEVKNWTGEDVTLVIGSREQRIEKIRTNENRFLVIGYGFLRTWIPDELAHPWDVIIFDEAHRLKNRKSQQTQGAKALVGTHKWLLTGTPIRNSPDEIWSLLNILDPLAFPHYWPFVEQFCNVWTAKWGRQIEGIKKESRQRWAETISPYIISRKKADYLKDLPEKLPEDIVYLDMTVKQKKMYDNIKDEMMAEVEAYNPDLYTATGPIIMAPNTGVRAARLRQITSSPMLLGSNDVGAKIPAAVEIIQGYAERGEKVVVFTYFRNSVDLLREALEKKKIKSLGIHGGVRHLDILNSVAEFRNSEYTTCLIGTIGCMAESVNLQVAHVILFLDKSYVPGDNEQAKDRIHRPGQQRKCVYIDLVVRNSVDVRIRKALEKKGRFLNDEERIRQTFRETFIEEGT